MISNDERLILKKLIDENACDNNTEIIRKLKHSSLIRDDITKLLDCKMDKKTDIDYCRTQCIFLFSNYMDIFNKIYNDELDLKMMWQFLATLERVEDGEMDQHESSVIIGKLLKEIYIDSALKKSKKLDIENEAEPEQSKVEGKNISWKEYRNVHL